MSDTTSSPAVAAEKAAIPKPPAKPVAKKTPEKRRFFLFTAVGSAWAAFTAATFLSLLGTLRFLFPNVLAEPPTMFKVGPSGQFQPGQVSETWKNSMGVWIVYLADEKRLVAVSTTCTHLGCIPTWIEQDQKFKCPCHGSGFYKTGVNFEGPAPRPLERFAIAEVDGVVVVDKSKKFQAELGQWNDPDSFLAVG